MNKPPFVSRGTTLKRIELYPNECVSLNRSCPASTGCIASGEGDAATWPSTKDFNPAAGKAAAALLRKERRFIENLLCRTQEPSRKRDSLNANSTHRLLRRLTKNCSSFPSNAV